MFVARGFFREFAAQKSSHPVSSRRGADVSQCFLQHVRTGNRPALHAAATG